MASDDKREVSVSQVVGRAVARLRRGEDRAPTFITQDDLARSARLAGLTGWTRSSVAALENGGRNLTADELLAMPVVLSLAGLGTHSVSELIQLGADETWAVRVWSLWEAMAPTEVLDGTWVEHLREMPLAGDDQGEAERNVAAQLGISMSEVSRLSEQIWGGPFTWARDVKAREQAGPNATARTMQALRGHVTRAMTEELLDALAAEGRDMAATIEQERRRP